MQDQGNPRGHRTGRGGVQGEGTHRAVLQDEGVSYESSFGEHTRAQPTEGPIRRQVNMKQCT